MGDAFLRDQRQALEENRRPEFFDITAWSAPLAFNLEAWVHDGDQPGRRPLESDGGTLAGEGAVGFLAAPRGLATYRLAACLLEEGVAFRAALAALHSGGREYPAGTLFVPRRPNPQDLEPRLRRCLAASGAALQGVESSFAERGIFLGAAEMLPVRRPRVALVRGDGVAAASFGTLWHLLDRTTELPVTAVEASELAAPALGGFDVVVLPAGDYARRLDETAGAALDRWVRAGGVLVAVGDAIAWLRERQLTGVRAWTPPERDPQADDAVPPSPADAVADRLISTPGAALATEMRRGQPLTAGLATPPATLVEGELVLLPTGDPQVDVLLAAAASPVRAGFAWPEAEERLAGSLLVASEARGEGRVVLFAQEPAFRLFWRGTMPLFLNAVLLEPSRHPRL
jgi:hypothetical protein